ncbi:tyrosine-type recombinase/integrase [Corynebacterium aurimucosum]|nr:tyrosine-type recombinase/integrase [Corynebacterium aurimucosum]NJJ82837.1 tyrosine-type recombinase/integrase [Corynebacterium aurimucosum]
MFYSPTPVWGLLTAQLSELKVGELYIESISREGDSWIARGFIKNLAGELVGVSEKGESEQSVREQMALQAWQVVFARTRFAVDRDSTILELVDIALKALRTGEAGRGNRVQTVNMYENHRKFLTGEKAFPPIGRLRLREVSSQAIHAWLAHVASTFPASARQLRVLLLHAFDIAMRQEVVEWQNNPARTARVPESQREEPVVLSQDEFQDLIALAQDWEKDKRTDMVGILSCLMATGIRPGELPALLWEEVGLYSKPPTLIVSGCAVWQDNAYIRQAQPKTAAGYRQIVILERFAEMLRERYARRAPGVPYVFPSASGSMLCMNNVGNRFRKMRGERFSHVKLKSFRSTVATRIAEARGAEEAARHLGHTSPAVTGRHYIKCPKETGNHNDLLDSYAPVLRWGLVQKVCGLT